MARAGYLAVSAAAILWAAGATVAGRMFERDASPIELTAARAWIALLGLSAFLLVRRGRAQRPRVPAARAALGTIVFFGASIAAANAMYYLAISRLPVAIAIVIQYTAPGLVVLWTALAERRAPSRRVVGALALAFAGVGLLAELPEVIARGNLTLDAWGIAAALGSSVAFSIYMLTGERVGPVYGSAGALVRGFAVASAFWVVFLAFRGRPDTLLDPSFAGGIAFVGVGATIAPFLLFLWGLGFVGASRAGIVSTLEPVAAAVFAFVWLDQTLGGVQIAGAVMVIAGITIVQSERPAPVEVMAEAAALE